MDYFVLVLLPLGLSFFIGWRFKKKAKEYSQIGLANGMTGAEIAKHMLNDNGIFDVSITSTQGTLSDHYNPVSKTVNLSHDVYYGRSVMSAAVAAHECGHAVQHARAYAPLQFRSSIIPFVSIASNWVQWILLAGVLAINFTQSTLILQIGVLLFAVTTFFSIVTLPVEYDASRRALAWLNEKNYLSHDEAPVAKSALQWAGSTYLIAALASIGTLLYYMNMLNRRN